MARPLPDTEAPFDRSGVRSAAPSLVAFAPAVFLSAFLLFQVQPLMGKYILPWFGGSPEVWTTCMLVFQALLLAGYAYAHLSVTRLRPRWQAALHAVLMVAAVATLPINPSAAWKPSPGGEPTLHIALLLAVSVGLPFFVLSATGPLLQAWVARLHPARSPYRLYALSNAGSLLALASYPFVVEPNFTRHAQGWAWSIALCAFVILCGLCASALWKHGKLAPPAAPDRDAEEGDAPVSRGARALWLALPAVASVELLAVTNKMTLDVAAVPFLWVLPLTIYLLTFVICFHHRRWYVRPLFLALFVASLVLAAVAKARAWQLSTSLGIAVFSFVLFATCMVCHGELYRLRPRPSRLTGYYLTIAAGGVVGGFLVAVVAPLVFRGYAELYLGLLACCVCVLAAGKVKMGRRRWVYVAVICVVGAMTLLPDYAIRGNDRTDVLAVRNFFGVLKVWDGNVDSPEYHYRILQHGTTFHGLEFIAPDKRLLATTYYSPRSGVGLTMRLHHADRPRRIGAVGLGVGTVATYCEAGDVLRFYELNPAVERVARGLFSYLPECPADVRVLLGDARLSMEAEPPRDYDVLILDAFSSDAVPVHLLTVEAFRTYLGHMAHGGVIAAHVSNHHVELAGVLWRLGRELGLRTAWIVNDEDPDLGIYASSWVLLARNGDFLDMPAVRDASFRPMEQWQHVGLWTDERVNLLEVLK